VLLTALSDGCVLCIVILEGGVAREFRLNMGFTPERDTLERLEGALRLNISAHAMPAKLLALEAQSTPTGARVLRALLERWGEVAPALSYSSGATPVLSEPESHDVAFLRCVLELLEHPASPSELSNGMNLSVDEPNGVSRVTVAFRSSLGRASVSILGPTRMRYPQVISVAKAISDALI
jgi:heat-inducible transcriptional repressor